MKLSRILWRIRMLVAGRPEKRSRPVGVQPPLMEPNFNWNFPQGFSLGVLIETPLKDFQLKSPAWAPSPAHEPTPTERQTAQKSVLVRFLIVWRPLRAFLSTRKIFENFGFCFLKMLKIFEIFQRGAPLTSRNPLYKSNWDFRKFSFFKKTKMFQPQKCF